MKTVAEVLRGAVTVLDERGWCQGSLGRQSGPVCAVGALRLASGSDDPQAAPFGGQDWRTYLDARDVVEDDLGILREYGRILSDWNDEPGRTVDEVKAALLAAAERAEAGA